MPIPLLGCKHRNFSAVCEVDYKEAPFPGMIKVRVLCKDCGLPFRFLGLPCGTAGVSVDGAMASLQIIPSNQQ